MLSNPADMAITRAIIALGHTLGLRIVAEGRGRPGHGPGAGVRWIARSCRATTSARPLPVQELEAWACQHQPSGAPVREASVMD